MTVPFDKMKTLMFTKNIHSAGFRTGFLCLVLTAVFFLARVTYAYWSQTPAARSGIILDSGTVVYMQTYVYAGNGSLVPARAVKDSLAANILSEFTPPSQAINYAGFSLAGFACDIIVRLELFYMDLSGIYQALDSGILSCEVWCDWDGDYSNFYRLAYDGNCSGYRIAGYPAGNSAVVMVKSEFALPDELLDPFYKNSVFKVRIMFEAIKI